CNEAPGDRMLIPDSNVLIPSGRAQRLKTVSCLLMAAALSSSIAPARSEPSTIRGAGASACSDYVRIYDEFRLSMNRTDGDISRHDSAKLLQYQELIYGYILGMETSLRGRVGQSDWDQVDIGKWVSDYCMEHRSEIVANAALALFKAMRGAPF